MERLGGATQRNLIIGGLVLLAVLVLGVVGWSVYTRGQISPQGIRIQTGLGIGGPGAIGGGNPGCDDDCQRYYGNQGYPYVKCDDHTCYFKSKGGKCPDCVCKGCGAKGPGRNPCMGFLSGCTLGSDGICECIKV